MYCCAFLAGTIGASQKASPLRGAPTQNKGKSEGKSIKVEPKGLSSGGPNL